MSSRRFPLALLLAVVLAPGGSAHADLGHCQIGIEKNTSKLDAKLLKGFQKCADFYRRALDKGTALSDTAPLCELQLEKAVRFPDTASALAVAKTALDALVPGTCTDADLRALGHLPTATFGDTWSRSLVIARLGATYDQQAELTHDLGTIFRQLSDAGGCALCAALAVAPCAAHSCRLGTGPSFVDVRTTSGAPVMSPLLTGQLTLELCRADNILPGDLVVAGGPSRTMRLGALLGSTSCLTITDVRGYVTCGASAPRVATATCQDHVVAPTPEVDDCAAGGFTDCGPQTADLIDGDPSGGSNTHVGATNGGECVQLTASAAAAGDALVLATAEMSFVRATQLGPDGVACTADDTATSHVAVTLPLTTATSGALVLDANDTPGSNFIAPLLTGTRFSCNNIEAGSLAPGKLVAAVPALHGVCSSPPCDDPSTAADEGSLPFDGAFSFTVSCQ